MRNTGTSSVVRGLAALGASALAVSAWWLLGPRAAVEPVAPAPAAAVDAGALRASPADSAVVDEIDLDASGRVDAGTPDATLHLRLLRRHDSSPVHPHGVELRRAGVPVQVAAAGGGRFALARPTGTEPLVLEVPSYEPERIESDLWQDVEVIDVLLQPVDGLFGRVVEADGTPAAGVFVVAMRPELGADVELVGERRPRVRMREELQVIAGDVTDEQGRYVLDVPTRASAAPLTVRAVGGLHRFTEIAVELPRPSGPLEDLVLGAPPSVNVVVLDERGAPVEAVVLASRLPRVLLTDAEGDYALRTDPDGRCVVPAWGLPVDVRPMARGWQPIRKRIDGIEAFPEQQLERLGQTVEWTLRRSAFVDVSAVDARTRAAVRYERAQLVPELAGRPVASMEVLAMAIDGTNSFAFYLDTAPGFFAEEAPKYDTIEVSLSEPGYEPVHRSVPRAELPPGGSLVLELEPVATARHVTGRALADGEPVGRADVQVRGIPPGAQGTSVACGHTVVETDAEGRFSLLVNPLDSAQRIAVEVRDPMSGRIAHVGPLAPEDAVALTLEFEPTVDVPVFLVGASQGESYSIHVEVESSDEYRPSWSVDVSARPNAHGEMGGILALPASTPVRLRLGGTVAHAAPAGARSEVRFDPDSSAASVTFDVARPRASLRGRAVLPPGADPHSHRVVAVLDPVGGGRGATFASDIDAQGGFGFGALPLGSWELILVRVESRANAPVLGRREVQLSENLGDVVLVADSD